MNYIGGISEFNYSPIQDFNNTLINDRAFQIPTEAENSFDKILETKRMLINEAFEKALLKLENMTVEEYKGFISEKAKDISETASVEIAAKYADSVSDEFIHSINPKLTKSKNTVESGFNIVMDKSSLNYNFKEIIKQIAEERDSEVSSLLFS